MEEVHIQLNNDNPGVLNLSLRNEINTENETGAEEALPQVPVDSVEFAPPIASNNSLPSPDVIIVDNDNSSRAENFTVETETPTSSRKKRKRRSKSKTSKESKIDISLTEEDDDGSICMICCEHYTMSGEHRLTSLKCGHLFGESCARRWLSQCGNAATRCCPLCKSKADFRDIRHIYAKKIAVKDNTEEVRLREDLKMEKQRSHKLETEHQLMTLELKLIQKKVVKLEADIERMRRIANANASSNASSITASFIDKPTKYLYDHKMHMIKNLEICSEPGCRCLAYASSEKQLFASQKSMQNLFRGYGVKYIDVATDFKPTAFLYTSTKVLRDLSLTSTEDLISCASQEKIIKVFDVKNRTVMTTITPSEKDIWSCAFDQDQRSHLLYLGSQHGSTYIYDIRSTHQCLEETSNVDDTSPVINIFPVPSSDMFPFGGYLVCKLQSLWFYEFLPTQRLSPNKLAVEGPFLSINYNNITDTILISTRISAKFPMSKYILGKLNKIDNIVMFHIELELFGSRVIRIMSRCTQIPIKGNSLVAAYIQDSKQLTLWNVGESMKIQSLPCVDTVYDTCPIIIDGNNESTYLAALTEMKCRIYKVESMLK
ncbi:E3 ubiquitin-protein ligase RFWD3-like [Condylostylus longicornis]|uniref:E3 ubiquitin-protein ligase RFWD3-like n=1 Tax=Condylostylus longicornis TaxID=2530218 RepID=UPI00244DC71F|nr:E3 ubiquitin-protein ligase RFWD3-like [Condylostylus longicornis]